MKLQPKEAAHREAPLQKGASVLEMLDEKEEGRERVGLSKMNIQTCLSDMSSGKRLLFEYGISLCNLT